MLWYEVLIIIATCIFVVGVIAWQIVRKIKGKGGCGECGGGCAHCSGCASCRYVKKSEEDPDKK